MAEGTWLCDTCGGPIENSTHGWIKWLTKSEGEGIEYGLRLVHHAPKSPRKPGSCQYDERAELGHGAIVCDLPLDQFLGSDGLMELLSWLERGKLPKQEVLELIRRLHIRGYELARMHLERAVAEGVIDEIFPPDYCSQDQINAVLNWLESRREAEV